MAFRSPLPLPSLCVSLLLSLLSSSPSSPKLVSLRASGVVLTARDCVSVLLSSSTFFILSLHQTMDPEFSSPFWLGLSLFPSPGLPLAPIHTQGYLESGVVLSPGLFQHNTKQPRPALLIRPSGEFISPGFISFLLQLPTRMWIKQTPSCFRTSQPSVSGGCHILTHNACFCPGGRCISKQWALSCSQKDSLSQYRSRPWNKNPYFLEGFVEHLPL